MIKKRRMRMAEILCSSQAHIPGRVLRQTRASPTFLFKTHSFPLTIFLSLNYQPLAGPLPRQEGIRLAKKGGFPSISSAGFYRFQISHPFPPRLFAATTTDGEGKP